VCHYFYVLRFVRVVKPLQVRTDWPGLVLLVIFLITFQVALDQGNRLNWFESLDFMLLNVCALTAFIVFVGAGILEPADAVAR
jgi:hypothetical protein